jgi:hypothetical protein
MTAAHHLTAVLAVGVARLLPSNRISADLPNAASIVAIERRPPSVDITGPVSAHSGRSCARWQMPQVDPLPTFKVYPTNGRKARESGLRLNAKDAPAAGHSLRKPIPAEIRFILSQSNRMSRGLGQNLRSFAYPGFSLVGPLPGGPQGIARRRSKTASSDRPSLYHRACGHDGR